MGQYEWLSADFGHKLGNLFTFNPQATAKWTPNGVLGLNLYAHWNGHTIWANMSGWMFILDMHCVIYLHLTLRLPRNKLSMVSEG